MTDTATDTSGLHMAMPDQLRTLAAALRVMTPADHERTHHAGCWQHHLHCAVERAAVVLTILADEVTK